MNILDALRGSRNDSAVQVEIGEFRLLCSGILYNGTIETPDWTKSDACRSLLTKPVALFVVSQPMDLYPQELLLRVPVTRVNEERSGGGNLSRVFVMSFPHREIAADLTALLTVLLRRLITVHSLVRTTSANSAQNRFGLPDYPQPIANTRPGVAWRRRPLGVLTMPDGTRELDDSASAPVRVDTDWLASVLTALPSIHTAKTIVACARLYSEGMQLIEERPEVAYQMFIAAAETLSSEALKDYSPTDDRKIKSKQGVYDRAKQLGLSEENAAELAILATHGMGWTSKKFQLCLMKYTDARLWQKDDLFINFDPILPKEDNFEQALSKIYHSRSGALHTGKSFPATVGLGTSPQVSIHALAAVLSGERLPPVTWFERVVQMALVSYIESQRVARTTNV